MTSAAHIIANPSIELRLEVVEGALSARMTSGLSGQVIVDGRMEVALRLPHRASHKVFLRSVVGIHSYDSGLQVDLADESGAFSATLQIETADDAIRLRARARAPEPAWMLEWRYEGWRLQDVIVPALGGQVVTREMPSDHALAYKYPFWWNAQFAVGTLSEDYGVLLRTEDADPTMKVLRIGREHDDFALGLAFEADAPLEMTTLAGTWFIQPFVGSWREGVEVHRRWMDAAFGLTPRARHTRRPSWVDDIDVVLEIWGMRGDRGRPGHSFDDMIRRIDTFALKHTPKTTLLYLPGFAEEGIDTNAPSYDPAPKCGGDDGFKRLIGRAHELGYRVMVHTNVLAMTFSHPRFPEFEDKQVVDPFGRLQGWGMDIDGDWLAEPFFAYINPGYTEWGDLMSEILGRLIREFELDAVFVDQTLLAFNDSRGPNFMTGMRQHIERLQHDFPGVLFAGEGLHEQVLAALPVAQIHGLDSIADVHGMEGTAAWRQVHPISVELFSRYTHFLPHLLTRHPSSPSYARQEAAYADLGIMPALVLYDRDQPAEGPAVEALLERARSLSQNRKLEAASQ